MKTYRVHIWQEDEFWIVHVPEIDCVTQASSYDDVVRMAKDLIATWLDTDESEIDIVLEVNWAKEYAFVLFHNLTMICRQEDAVDQLPLMQRAIASTLQLMSQLDCTWDDELLDDIADVFKENGALEGDQQARLANYLKGTDSETSGEGQESPS